MGKKSKPSKAVLDARMARARVMASEIRLRNVRLGELKRRAKDSEDKPIQNEHVIILDADNKAFVAEAAKMAIFAGTKLVDINREDAQAHRELLVANMQAWRDTLSVHEDIVDNWEDWGGKDLGGAETTLDDQMTNIRSLRAAIEAAEEELLSIE